MFEQTFVDAQNYASGTRYSKATTMAASTVVQVGLVGLLLIIPLLHPEGPLMKLDPPPVVFRPVTIVELAPRVATSARVVRPTLSLASLLVAPRTVPTRTAQITDAPEVHGDITPFVPGAGTASSFIGAIPMDFPAPPAANHATTPPVAVTPAPVPAVPLRVSTSVQAALLMFGPKPTYPPLAKAARVQGTVRLQAIIGTDGNIRNLRLVSGPPLLVKAALDAVQTWRYRPTVLNGTRVEVSTEVEVNFTLMQ